MPTKKMTHEQACTELAGYGFESQETYPGTTMRFWRIRCTECQQARRVRLAVLRDGLRCTHILARRNARYRQLLADAGFIIDAAWTGTKHDPCEVTCVRCLLVQEWSPAFAESGHAVCPCRANLSEIAEMTAACYRPVVVYPGAARRPWPSVCMACDKLCRPSLGSVRAGKRCLHHNPPQFEY